MYQLVLNLGVILISLDMHQAYVREYYETEKKEQLLKIAFLPGNIIFIIVFCFCFLMNKSLSKLILDKHSFIMDVCIFLGIYFVFCINIFSHVVRMQGRAWAFSATQIIPKLGYLIILGICIYLFSNHNYDQLIFINVFVLLLSVLCFIFILRYDIYKAIKIKIDINKLKQMLLFSYPLIAGSLGYWALTGIDRIFLKNLASFSELAIYAVASTISAGVGLFATVFSNLWHPIVYKWIKEGIDTRNVIAINESMVLFIALIWTFVGVFSWLIIYFFPQEYNGIQLLIIGCIAMPLLYMLSETTTIGIGISRKTKYSMITALAALVLNIIINYCLIDRYGAKACALASMSAFVLFLILRTEFSSFLWISLPRHKMYISVAIYFFVTIVIMFELVSNTLVTTLLWLISFLIVLFLYRQRVLGLLEFIKLRNTQC